MRGVLVVAGALVLAGFVLLVYDRPAASGSGVTTVRFAFWGNFEERGTWRRVK